MCALEKICAGLGVVFNYMNSQKKERSKISVLFFVAEGFFFIIIELNNQLAISRTRTCLSVFCC
jgi:hypothetical protein